MIVIVSDIGPCYTIGQIHKMWYTSNRLLIPYNSITRLIRFHQKLTAGSLVLAIVVNLITDYMFSTTDHAPE